MLFWFRNDLRLHDNPALKYFVQALDKGLAQRNTTDPLKSATAEALFFITPKQWQQHHWSAIKIDLIKRHVNDLAKQLTSYGIRLNIIEVADFNEQVTFLTNYCQQHGIQQVIANSEVEINEVTRDQALIARGVNLTLFEADVIVRKGKVLNQTGQMYKVFTPFKKAWLSYVKSNGFEYLGKLTQATQLTQLSQLTQLTAVKISSLTKQKSTCDKQTHLSDSWPLAREYEQQVLPSFLADKLSQYKNQRDFPAIKGTSGISAYLAIGAISPRYVLTLLLNKYPDLLYETESDNFPWLNELIWREFYRHLLFHQPRLCKGQCFQTKYQQSKYQQERWPFNQQHFNAWCEGKTGYPLVDAAMRQLNQTGWMHNRLRMVVASFLTKHLLIDWRHGERYFMQQLIDGDLAANNGGWQWAASTGCDAQPYFRIFNPIRQSERFDPSGEFIRRYIPELNEIPDKEIHFPHKYMTKNNIKVYWPAIVEHKTARLNALAFYK